MFTTLTIHGHADVILNESNNNANEEIHDHGNTKTITALVKENGIMAAVVEDLRGQIKKKKEEDDLKELQVIQLEYVVLYKLQMSKVIPFYRMW